jgi:hypothetical protein
MSPIGHYLSHPSTMSDRDARLISILRIGFIAADSSFIDDWLAYSEDKRTSGAGTFGVAVSPVFHSLARGEKLTQQWKAGKGWVSS